jgi:DNA-directed RNA polymerase specialized sigma24 family protein
VAMEPTLVRRSAVTELERIYREQSPRLYRSLLLFAGDSEIAADAVAEAFAQALQRGDAIRSPERWVWTAAFRVAAGELARMRRTVPGKLHEVGYQLPDTLITLDLMMRELSPMQRAAVALHDFAGYTLRETATIVGSTASAVSVHLVRAHVKLRKMLEERDEG